MHSRVRSGQSRWRTGSTSMSGSRSDCDLSLVVRVNNRKKGSNRLRGRWAACTSGECCQAVKSSAFAAGRWKASWPRKCLNSWLVLRIAKEWQQRGGDVARHGRGHQTAQQGRLGNGWRHWSERGGLSSMEEWQTLLHILDNIASFFMCLTTTR